MGRKTWVFLIVAVVLPLSGYTIERSLQSRAPEMAIQTSTGAQVVRVNASFEPAGSSFMPSAGTRQQSAGPVSASQQPDTPRSASVGRLILIGVALMGLIALRGGRSAMN